MSGEIQIKSLAPTCPVSTRYVGETLTLASTPSGGTLPYKYTFWKISPGGTSTIIGSANQLSNTIAYKLVSADVTTVSGTKLQIGVDVYDSCITGALSATESCLIDVAAPACITPTVNMVLS